MTSATTDTKRAAAKNEGPLSPELLDKMNAYWRAANYLSVGQIYLKDNPLLERPLTLDDVKPRLLGHWGTTPGLNFLYVHWNRLIRERDLNMIYIIGPGHGGPGLVANTYLEGSYSEIYPAHRAEPRRHQAPLPPVQLALRHSQPRCAGDTGLDSRRRRAWLLAGACLWRGVRQSRSDRRLRGGRRRSGDRTAGHKLALEQVPQSGDRWRGAAHSASERLQDRQSQRCWRAFLMRSLKSLMRGYGYEPFTLEGDDPATMHQKAAAVFDTIFDRIAAIQKSRARRRHRLSARRGRMLIMRTPKGWTGPKVVDGKPVENTWRAHQVPLLRIAREARAPAPARRVDAQLQAGRAVRRKGRIPRRAGRDRAQGPPCAWA